MWKIQQIKTKVWWGTILHYDWKFKWFNLGRQSSGKLQGAETSKQKEKTLPEPNESPQESTPSPKVPSIYPFLLDATGTSHIITNIYERRSGESFVALLDTGCNISIITKTAANKYVSLRQQHYKISTFTTLRKAYQISLCDENLWCTEAINFKGFLGGEDSKKVTFIITFVVTDYLPGVTCKEMDALIGLHDLNFSQSTLWIICQNQK